MVNRSVELRTSTLHPPPHSSLVGLVEVSSILNTMPALLSRSMSRLPMAEAGVSTPPCSMPARFNSSSCRQIILSVSKFLSYTVHAQTGFLNAHSQTESG